MKKRCQVRGKRYSLSRLHLLSVNVLGGGGGPLHIRLGCRSRGGLGTVARRQRLSKDVIRTEGGEGGVTVGKGLHKGLQVAKGEAKGGKGTERRGVQGVVVTIAVTIAVPIGMAIGGGKGGKGVIGEELPEDVIRVTEVEEAAKDVICTQSRAKVLVIAIAPTTATARGVLVAVEVVLATLVLCRVEAD